MRLVLSIATAFFLYGCSTSDSIPSWDNPKIWAHRVNDTEKLARAEQQFTGVELDIVISPSGCLDIVHPPDPSQGLCLDHYFRQVQRDSLHFWLDIKNLQQDNLTAFAEQLTQQMQQENIARHQVIVESPAAELLPYLEEQHFQVSYYLPGITDFEIKDRPAAIEKIRKRLTEYHISTISTAIQNYPYLVEHFPQEDKLLWATGELDAAKTALVDQALADDKVKVILVTID